MIYKICKFSTSFGLFFLAEFYLTAIKIKSSYSCWFSLNPTKSISCNVRLCVCVFVPSAAFLWDYQTSWDPCIELWFIFQTLIHPSFEMLELMIEVFWNPQRTQIQNPSGSRLAMVLWQRCLSLIKRPPSRMAWVFFGIKIHWRGEQAVTFSAS